MPIESTTTNNAFRVPTAANNGTDFVTGVSDLASDIDAMNRSGTLISRPAASKTNRAYYATDTLQFFKDTGSAWVQMLALGAGFLATHSISGNYTAVAGDLVVVSSGNPTVTLPSAASNSIVGVFVLNGAVSGSAPVTVSGSKIYGVGLANASSFLLGTPGAFTILHSDGTNWMIVAGQQDTGWLAVTLGANIGDPIGYAPAVRVIGTSVEMSGRPVTTAGGVTAIGTVPVIAVPRQGVPVQFPPTPLAPSWLIDISGNITASTGPGSGTAFHFDGLTYRLA